MKLLAVIALLATVTTLQAYHTNLQDTKEVNEWRRGIPNLPNVPGAIDQECIKDLLLMLDMSSSIGRDTFENQIKGFVREFIRSPLLNIGPDGTHVALIIFSETDQTTDNPNVQDKTKLLFGFGTYLTQDELVGQIDGLDWDTLGAGAYTETEFALMITNDDVFPEMNPTNWRAQIADLVVLITDGAPNPKAYTPQELIVPNALAQADILKGKGVQIVTIGTGEAGHIDATMRSFLEDAATAPEDSFEASFEELPTIIESLVAASCRKYEHGDCACNDVGSRVRYMSASEKKLEVRWPEPELVCKTDVKYDDKVVTPDYTSPHSFGPGNHVITYEYVFGPEASVSCDVNIPIKSCECPSVAPSVHYVASGNQKVSVSLDAPKLACRPSLENSNNVPSRQLFAVGKHKVTYKFEIEPRKFLSCDVDVEVKGVPCKGKNYDPKTEICCCGKIHKQAKNGACCGLGYYDTTKVKCCPFNWNLVALKDECPKANI